jgi:hypothetical protein
MPLIERVATARIAWKELSFAFAEGRNSEHLTAELEAVVGTNANKALFRLELGGALAIEESGKLAQVLESLRARLIRLKLENATMVAPSESELQSLVNRAEDPLVSRVASRLARTIAEGGADAAVAGAALRELYLATVAA